MTSCLMVQLITYISSHDLVIHLNKWFIYNFRHSAWEDVHVSDGNADIWKEKQEEDDRNDNKACLILFALGGEIQN